MTKQVVFKDLETNENHAGFRLDDGTVICACCGGTFEPDEVEILRTYDWIDLQYEIAGDDYVIFGITS